MVISNLNFTTGSTIPYSLLVINGNCSQRTPSILLTHQLGFSTITKIPSKESKTVFTAHGGRFKAIVELSPGLNVLRLYEQKEKGLVDCFKQWAGIREKSEHDSDGRIDANCVEVDVESMVELKLSYHEGAKDHIEKDGGNDTNKNRKGHVRVVYLVAKGWDGSFEGPEQETTTLESGVKRLGLAGRMVQSLMADMMHRAGFGRMTFHLQRDVCVHRLEKTFEELSKLGDHELYQEVCGSLRDSKIKEPSTCSEYAIDMAVMSFTRYDKTRRRALCHTALGGYPLALFGGGALYSWPESVADIQRRFCDTRRVDSARFFDDSAFRSQNWALLSTTVGALLHELGHALGLAHPVHTGAGRGVSGDVMLRGFDFINRLFVNIENGRLLKEPSVLPIWEQSGARRLSMHPMIGHREEQKDPCGKVP